MRHIFKYIITTIVLLFSINAFAGNQVFSGILDGAEPTTLGNATDCTIDGIGFDLVGPFQVSVTSNYEYIDISYGFTPDITEPPYINMTMGIYDGIFNPASPATNQVSVNNDTGTLALTSGQDYYIVVQDLNCTVGGTGKWMFSLNDTGDITGTITNDISNAFVFGEINETDPVADLVYCGFDSHYVVSGPFTVPESAIYAYGDLSYFYGIGDTLSALYEDSFDPNNPNDNQLYVFDDYGETMLMTGTDYYLVLQPYCDGEEEIDTTDYPLSFISGFVSPPPIEPPPPAPPAPPATPVPTISVWGLGILAGLLGLMGFVRRRKV